MSERMAPEQDLRAAREHVTAVATVLRQALAEDDRLAGDRQAATTEGDNR